MYRAWFRSRANLFPKNTHYRGYSQNPGSSKSGGSKLPLVLGLGAVAGATYYLLAYPVPGLEEYQKQIPVKVPQLPSVEEIQGYVKSVLSTSTTKPNKTTSESPAAPSKDQAHHVTELHEEKHTHPHADESRLEPVVVIAADPIVMIEEPETTTQTETTTESAPQTPQEHHTQPSYEKTHEPEVHTIETPPTEHKEELEPQQVPKEEQVQADIEGTAPQTDSTATAESASSPAPENTSTENAAAEEAAAMAVVLEIPLVELEQATNEQEAAKDKAETAQQEHTPQTVEEPLTQGNLLIGFSLQQIAKAFNVLQTTEIGSPVFVNEVDSLPPALKTLVVALASDIVSRQAQLLETFKREFALQEAAHESKYEYLALSKEEQLKNAVQSLEQQMQQILDKRIKDLEKMKQDEIMEEYAKINERNKEELHRIKELRLIHHYNRLEMIRQLSVTLDSYKHLLQASSNYDLKSQHVHRLTLGLLALTDAMEAGRPLAPEVSLLRSLAKDNATVAAALDALPAQIVAKGVSTRPELINRFQNVYKVGRKAAFVPEGGGMWWLLYSTMLNAVTIEEKGLIDGSDAKHILARALYWAEKDRLDKSLEELALLKGMTSTIVSDWCKDATNRLLLEQAVKLMKAQVACEASSLA